jgi:NAD binding domain of 6-phosphogluconate dehydrogenase
MAVRVLCFANNLKNAVTMTEMLARNMSTGPKNIGFVGLGQMGHNMASNLMKKVNANSLQHNTACTRCENSLKGLWQQILEFFGIFLQNFGNHMILLQFY